MEIDRVVESMTYMIVCRLFHTSNLEYCESNMSYSIEEPKKREF